AIRSDDAREREKEKNLVGRLWLHLAYVYRELGEFDVLSGLLSGDRGQGQGLLSDTMGNEMREALKAEGASDWVKAEKSFQTLLHRGAQSEDAKSQTAQTAFVMNGYCDAAAHLTRWDALVHEVAEHYSAFSPPF
ncbi:hypothetical protein SARC_14881, partial [Sphaeroforma arctica JP610]